MYMFINALIMALLLPTGAEQAGNLTACRAELKGVNLLTAVQLPGGVVIEGPWHLKHDGKMQEGRTHFWVIATLDRVIERDAVTGEKRVIPFPEPVTLTYDGTTQEELVHKVTQVWCVTVMRAHENQALDQLPANRSGIMRIVAVPGKSVNAS
jgi:hypothetical protein